MLFMTGTARTPHHDIYLSTHETALYLDCLCSPTVALSYESQREHLRELYAMHTHTVPTGGYMLVHFESGFV